MCLTASGRIQVPSDGNDDENRFYHPGANGFGPGRFFNLPYDVRTCAKLQHIAKAVEVLTINDAETAKFVLEMSTRVRIVFLIE